MAIDNINQITPAMTFQQWWETTNTVISSLENVVTMGSGQNNDDDIITTGKLHTTDEVDGVVTNVLTPLNFGDTLQLKYNNVTFNQKQTIYVPAEGLSNTIQFVRGTDASVPQNNTWAMGPVHAPGSNISNHADFQITGKSDTGDSDALFTFRRSTGTDKGVLTGTNVVIDDAILPAEISSTCATSNRFVAAPLVKFTGDTAGQFYIQGELQEIEANIAVDFSSVAGVKSLTAGTGIAFIGPGVDDVATPGKVLDGSAATDDTATIVHGDTSSVSNTSNTGLSVIQNIEFDEFGHVTAATAKGLGAEFVKLAPSVAGSRSVVGGAGIAVGKNVKISFRSSDGDEEGSEGFIESRDHGLTIQATQSPTAGEGGEIRLRATDSVFIQGLPDNTDNVETLFEFDIEEGNFIASGDITAYYSFSDRTLKENIEPITDALDKVNSINGYTFNYIDAPEKGRVPGVIAQELEQVLPEAVYDTGNGTKAVRYDNTIALLVEAIKELKQQVDELKGK